MISTHRCREGRVHGDAGRSTGMPRPAAPRDRPLPPVREPTLRRILSSSAPERISGPLGPLELVPDGPRAPPDAGDAAARNARRPAFTRSAGRRRAAAHALGRRRCSHGPRDVRRGPLGRRGRARRSWCRGYDRRGRGAAVDGAPGLRHVLRPQRLQRRRRARRLFAYRLLSSRAHRRRTSRALHLPAVPGPLEEVPRRTRHFIVTCSIT